MSQLIYLVEIQVAVDAAGTLQMLRYGSEGYVTFPSDVPANTFYEDRLVNTGSVVRTVYSNGTTGGSSEVGYGYIELSNPDGELDILQDYGFDGRTLRVLVGCQGAAYSTFTEILSGTMEQPEFTFKNVSVKVRDRLFELDTPLCFTLYAGSNSLPSGEEGTANDIKGQPKPRCYGKVFNVSPPCVNTSKLIYQVNDGAINSIPNVYDKGAALTAGADYTSVADMETNAPAASNYRVYPAGGYFRLGSAPAGQITADVVQGAAASNRTVAQLLKQIAIDTGISSGDISSGDVTALDTLNNAEVGVYVQDSTPSLQIMDAVAASIGAYYIFDTAGVLRMGQLVLPSGSPVAEFIDDVITDIELIRSQDADKGIPAYRVIVNYSKNYTVQESDLAGVAASRLAYLANEYRSVKTDDTAVLTKHPLSPEITRDTLLVLESAAQAEATRLQTMYGTRRAMYQLKVRLEPDVLSVLDLNAVIRITLDRFDMDGGQLFRVLGVETDFSRNKATLTVWG